MTAALASLAQPLFAQAPATNFEITDNSFLVEEAFNQEPGVFQNIANLRLDGGGNWTTTFTQEWPLVTQRHQLSYTLPFADIAGASGIGDAAIHYRLQLFNEGTSLPAFSPRVSLILPSGRASRGLGNGHLGWEFNLPFSKQVRAVYLHWNAGLTQLPRAIVDGVDRDLVTPRVAASAIWQFRPMLNLMLESMVEWPEGDADVSRRDVVTLLPGFRTGWNIGDAQVIVGLGVPIVFQGGAQRTALFLYGSYELPFARPKPP